MQNENIKSKEWTRRLSFSALAGWLILSVTLAVTAYIWYGMDFRGYYAAARVLMAGGNPYDYDLVAQELLSVTGEMGNNPYYYPPWFAWIFVPLARVPFQVARIIWMTANIMIWNISLWWLGEITNWPPKGAKRYLFFAMTTFSFAWVTWRYEQAGILVLAILIMVTNSIQQQRWNWTGVWLALLLIKPNVTIIVVAGICLWLFRKRLQQPVIVMALTLMGLLAISTWITPAWYKPFFEERFGQGLQVALDGPDKVVALRINTTFLDWLATMNVPQNLRISIYAIVILMGIVVFFWAIFRSDSLLELVSILLLISYALTPYALQYDFPPLSIVLFWGISLCASLSQKALRVGIWISVFIFSVIFWQQNISWAFWMVVGLILLSGWGLYQKNCPCQGQFNKS